MKRRYVVALIVLMAMILSGCCLKHNMQPATCTQPSTCSKCGKTEGEPLGHKEEIDAAKEPSCTETGLTEGRHCSVCGEVLAAQEEIPALGHKEEIDAAKEPSCTETGLTEGRHCSVCGEVLAAQEEIPALGHDWIRASFKRPQVCAVCGEKGEEALGYKLFILALNPETEKHTELLPAEEKRTDIWTTKEAEPVFRTFHISGFASGLDEVSDIINKSSLKLTVDTRDEGRTVLAGEIAAEGAEPVDAVLVFDEKGLSFALPGITEDGYHIDMEDLQKLTGMVTDVSSLGMPSQSTLISTETDAIKKVLARYEEIIFSVFDQHNTEEFQGAYEFELLDGSEECIILAGKPTAGDWRSMLRTLFRTMYKDTELRELLCKAADIYYNSDAFYSYYYTAEEFENEILSSFYSELEKGILYADQIARRLAQVEFAVAYRDNRLYALKFTDGEGIIGLYESDGTLDDQRVDVVACVDGDDMYMVGNTMQRENDRVTGQTFFSEPTITVWYSFGREKDGKPSFDVRLSLDEDQYRIALTREGENALFTAVYDTASASVELEILATPGEETASLPEGKIKEIITEEDLESAFAEIAESLDRAGLFAPA